MRWYLSIRVIKNKVVKKLYFMHNTYIKKITKRFQLNNPIYLATFLLITKFRKNK